jgi:hypothetical protein
MGAVLAVFITRPQAGSNRRLLLPDHYKTFFVQTDSVEEIWPKYPRAPKALYTNAHLFLFPSP